MGSDITGKELTISGLESRIDEHVGQLSWACQVWLLECFLLTVGVGIIHLLIDNLLVSPYTVLLKRRRYRHWLISIISDDQWSREDWCALSRFRRIGAGIGFSFRSLANFIANALLLLLLFGVAFLVTSATLVSGSEPLLSGVVAAASVVAILWACCRYVFECADIAPPRRPIKAFTVLRSGTYTLPTSERFSRGLRQLRAELLAGALTLSAFSATTNTLVRTGFFSDERPSNPDAGYYLAGIPAMVILSVIAHQGLWTYLLREFTQLRIQKLANSVLDASTSMSRMARSDPLGGHRRELLRISSLLSRIARRMVRTFGRNPQATHPVATCLSGTSRDVLQFVSGIRSLDRRPPGSLIDLLILASLVCYGPESPAAYQQLALKVSAFQPDGQPDPDLVGVAPTRLAGVIDRTVGWLERTYQGATRLVGIAAIVTFVALVIAGKIEPAKLAEKAP